MNNAGIAFKGSLFNADMAQTTQDTNFYGARFIVPAPHERVRDPFGRSGTMRVCDALLPLAKANARVVK